MKNLILLSLLFTLTACSGGSTTGNPVRRNVSVSMQDQQPFAWIQNISDAFINRAHANVSSISFCFKRLRFKPDASTSGSNFDLFIGQVAIDPNGTNLLTVSVPEGTYGRIEFDLEEACDGDPAKPSVSFTNDFGMRSTNDRMTIKFEGSYTVSADGTLNLDIDALIDNMELVNNDANIKSALESATGQY